MPRQVPSQKLPTLPSAYNHAWWNKDYHAARRPYLLARNIILKELREFFNQRDFTEVETSILQKSPGHEVHLHALSAQLHTPDGAIAEHLYLHTSPEFAAKKLLAAGEERIFTLARCFRDREQGPLHSHEFTMLEWYRTNEEFIVLIEDCINLLRRLAKAIGEQRIFYQGKVADLIAAPQIISVAEALSLYAAIDLDSVLDGKGCWQRDKLAKAAQGNNLRIAEDDSASDIFSRIMVEKIEPYLGLGRMTFLNYYPIAEAALARSSVKDRRFAERFELYICGVELANAFGELNDVLEQRRRFESAMIEKEKLYGISYLLDEDFLNALQFMPPASGIALGLDRLVMLLTGAQTIQQVMWTP